MQKPRQCFEPTPCPLANISNGFSRPEGTGALGVAIIGEALGDNEVKDGLPFRPYAEAGSTLQSAIRIARTELQRAVLDRDGFYFWNVVACFVSSRVSIFTPTGYREMRSLSVGDRVLTHEARFRQVTEKIKKPTDGEGYKIFIQTEGDKVSGECFVSVTKEHKFLSGGEWKEARELKTGNSINVLGEFCHVCGKTFFRGFRNAYRSLPFCSISCHNWYATSVDCGKHDRMLQQYVDGKRDRYGITKAANEAFRLLIESGWKPDRPSEESFHRGRLRAAITRQFIGLNGEMPWVGKGEDILAGILEALGHSYIPQFALGTFNYDFLVGSKLIIEVDGEGARRNGEAIANQPIKDQYARDLGYAVIHIDSRKPEEIIGILDNDSHAYPIIEAKILLIAKRYYNRVGYTLAVEEDESYVAQGTVNHNCQPPHNKLSGASYEEAAVNHCSFYLNYAMGDFIRRNPDNRALLACGNVPLKYLTGATGKQGDRQSVSDLRGYILQSKYGWVVPTYHPSFVRRGNLQLMPCLVSDLKKALAVAEGKYDKFPGGRGWVSPNYLITPSIDDARSFLYHVRDNTNRILSCDIETSKSRYFDEDTYTEGEVEGQLGTEIVLVQFSTRKGQGIALSPKFHLDVIKALLETDNVKVGHNWWLFDAPRIREAGWKVNGPVHDTMWMFRKHRPELPSGLQAVAGWAGFPFPWKHLFDKELEWYGCADVDSVHCVLEWIIPQMQAMGTWKHYHDHVFRYRVQVLRPAEERGIPVSEDARQELKTRLEIRRDEEDRTLQELVPAEVRPLKPRRKVKFLNEKGEEDSVISFGYRKAPKALKQFEVEYNLTPVDERGPWAKEVYDRLGLVLRETPDVDYGSVTIELKSGKQREKPIKSKKGEILPGRIYLEKRWAKTESFKASKQQLTAYIKWKRTEIENGNAGRHAEES